MLICTLEAGKFGNKMTQLVLYAAKPDTVATYVVPTQHRHSRCPVPIWHLPTYVG
jgi:hypothetical protein